MKGLFQINDEKFLLRAVEPGDFDKGHLQLLAQLSPTTQGVTREDYETFVDFNNGNRGSRYLYVIEDLAAGKLVACGTLLVEIKLIHQVGVVGHVEDVVVDTNYRNMGLGQKIIHKLVKKADSYGCYKVILHCQVDKKGFYEKCGFQESGIEMRCDL